MTPGQFLQVTQVLPEPMLLISTEGEILAGNKSLVTLLGWRTKDLVGKCLWEFTSESPEQITQYLQACAKNRQFVLGCLTLHQCDGQQLVCRVQGAVIRPWTAEAPALNLVRLESRAVANFEFTVLSQKIDELTIEIHERKRTQAELSQANEALQQLLNKFQETQLQLVQTEKMSSLGQLVAGIAHEVNNPVNFIHGNLVHSRQYLDDLLGLLHLYQEYYPAPVTAIQKKMAAIDLEFLQEDLNKVLKSMQLGTERIREIVKSLRSFSRLDEADVKEVDIHEGIDSTLVILQSRLKATSQQQGIEVVKEYGSLPLINCYAGQLNQVFMNLLSNAIDALEAYNQQRATNDQSINPSQIRIRTMVCQEGWIAIVITDNGAGIPETVRQKIFDPFFTTKPVGKGTGLGLSISYKIVKEGHGGNLHCASELGRETTFTVEIPVCQPISSSVPLQCSASRKFGST